MIAAMNEAAGTGGEVAVVDEVAGTAEVSPPWLTPRDKGGGDNNRRISAVVESSE